MPTREVVIGSSVGLHARPASDLARNANESGHTVKIGRPGQNAVDARSILAVISLGVKQGESIYLDVEGDRSEDVLDTLAEMLAHTE
ncbi:HPr family phosphocarrier protein [Paramicrobacterium chengjingii]|uniref:HPr family phosphocarrier protein n=1 Tax=Paramicrobacterium chengjingii TaxID=2769067 RepID=UPI0014248C62|nr:HPr family phosphocarrier protein [Microbacterium chengjingii]